MNASYNFHNFFNSSIPIYHVTDITTEILPRLFKVKYENGAIKEHYHLEMPIEHKYSSNQTVLQCEKVTHETVFQQLRVYHVGRLRVAFSPDLKVKEDFVLVPLYRRISTSRE